MKSALVMCSGGLDSVVAAFYAKRSLGYSDLTLIFFNYGQRNLKQERKSSKWCAKKLKAHWIERDMQWLKRYTSSSLTSKTRSKAGLSLKDTKKESQAWYVPCRNLLFFSESLALAESSFLKGRPMDIIIGLKNEGEEYFPDASPTFLSMINNLSKTSTNSRAKVIAPLMKMDKEDIVLLGNKLKVPLEKTYSCYSGKSDSHCGECLACRLRKAGFYWAGAYDPTVYSKN